MEAQLEKEIKTIESEIEPDTPESDIPKAISQCNDNPEGPILVSPPLTVKKTVTSTGARISTQIDQQNHQESEVSGFLDGVKMVEKVKEEAVDGGVFGSDIRSRGVEADTKVCDNEKIKEESDVGFAGGKSLEEKKVVGGGNISKESVVWKLSFEEWLQLPENNHRCKKESPPEEGKSDLCKVKEQSNVEVENKATVKQEVPEFPVMPKKEPDVEFEGEKSVEEKKAVSGGNISKESLVWNLSFEEWLQLPENNHNLKKKSPPEEGKSDLCKVEETNVEVESKAIVKQEVPEFSVMPQKENEETAIVKKDEEEVICAQPLQARKMSHDEYARFREGTANARCNVPRKERVEDRALSTVVIENGDFPEEPDWLLVGRNIVIGLSTTKGRKLEDNEIVHFSFPFGYARNNIVRFSTKRYGEIGRLPMEWAKCLIPLVSSSKVKVLGRCVGAPENFHLMQEIMLYASFYIHRSVFTEGEKSSWRLDSPSQIDSTTYPLLTLFKLLKINSFQEAEFTPEELDSRKRSLKLSGVSEESASTLPMLKRRKVSLPSSKQNEDEQAISESSLNKLVGAVDMYDLQEMEPPETLMCDLRPYQKQALFWMTELEKGENVEEAAKTLHPCWGAYRICDERAPAIYVNSFSGEATTQLPTATQMARGGILADAMGLGKTVMTIALLLARCGKGIPDNQEFGVGETAHVNENRRERDSFQKVRRKVKGGTLIVCPMALLGQWKDELETHSKPDSISVSIHYGGDRSTDSRVLAAPDVVLTTYGVLTASYKNDGEYSIFNTVEWHRVVLDEAHTIKSSRTQAAQAAFTLSAYCRWCLTGTPLQNNLEDLYSLLCFLHVEPWCNWAWWQKLIQKPYENGDQRGLKLIKAILRPLMLRRTKETKDKEGRPILVLPPTDIQVIECEQSEEESDFYDALFKRSKVQFDQFVAQGKVLHNYANILELLLRLRQCCNHPFLVMSRGDTQRYADLNKLARKFLETHPDSATQNLPSRAYVEEVVEGLRKGESAECPICLESSDDPILTPCAHRMCRECLLACWRTPSAGACPICRQILKKTDLITCPSENRFRVDVEKNWKESSKVSKLLDCLEQLRQSGSGEKSIVFSQWTSFLDLLEIPLQRRRMGYLRFDGSLAQKQRERVLKEFSETGEKMVLLMSLKAGGVGLNLTAASNVFLMDPWWNPAVEEQAIMRIHRIGQKRTVRVRRFIVKETVEERMQQVQARKQRMIAGALTDEEVRSARIEELKMLFR